LESICRAVVVGGMLGGVFLDLESGCLNHAPFCWPGERLDARCVNWMAGWGWVGRILPRV